MEEEKKVEKKKKKRIPRVLYWLIVIVGLTFIYFMSYRIGQRIAKDSEDKNVGKDVSEKSNSNVVSNNNSDVNSNITSNENSDANSNVTSNDNNQVTTYSIKDFTGTFVSKEAEGMLKFSTQATYLSDVYGVPACGAGKLGNFVVEDNKIYMYPLVSTGCDDDSWKLINENVVVATIVSKDELVISGKSYKRTDSTSLNETDGGLRYGISVIENKGKN